MEKNGLGNRILLKCQFSLIWSIIQWNANQITMRHFLNRNLQADSKVHMKCEGLEEPKQVWKRRKLGR